MYRLEKLTKLLNTAATYDILSLSQLDGMDVYSQRFNVLVTTLKKKPYDILEHRKADFDIDYDDFQRQLLDLNVRTSTHMFTKPFPWCVSVHAVLAPLYYYKCWCGHSYVLTQIRNCPNGPGMNLNFH